MKESKRDRGRGKERDRDKDRDRNRKSTLAVAHWWTVDQSSGIGVHGYVVDFVMMEANSGHSLMERTLMWNSDLSSVNGQTDRQT